jgi:hypothetical protein
VRGRREDGAREPVRTSLARLLVARDDGQGRFYTFLAWMPRSYSTWATVVEIEGDSAVLVLPEWHPARPVRLPTRLLPQGGGGIGAWLQLRADLSVAAAGQLNLSMLAYCADPGSDRCLRPTWRAPGP